MLLNTDKPTLYAVTDGSHGEELYKKVRLALEGVRSAGGSAMIQLREKELTGAALLEQARTLSRLCAEYGAPFIINDYAQLAREVDADGVHLGQGDMSVLAAREILGSGKIIGATAHTVQQALSAQRQGADYIGAGAAFPTGTKSDTTIIGTEGIAEICRAVSIPVFAIGGIKAENVEELLGTGIRGVAVVSAVFAAEDIRTAAAELIECGV